MLDMLAPMSLYQGQHDLSSPRDKTLASYVTVVHLISRETVFCLLCHWCVSVVKPLSASSYLFPMYPCMWYTCLRVCTFVLVWLHMCVHLYLEVGIRSLLG